MEVQIWAPGLDAEPVAAVLSRARLGVHQLTGVEQASGDHPLVLIYTDPVGLLDAATVSGVDDAAAYQAILSAIGELAEVALSWRLVNLACFSPPALVGWCVAPQTLPTRPDMPVAFRCPDALEALLTRQWLARAPGVLDAYLHLEHHPRSATLDHRSADDACLARLEEASSPAALAQARRRAQTLEEQLTRFDAQLQDLHRVELENQALRDQLVSLELERDRRQDLELTVQLAQEELSLLNQRLSLLEELVRNGAAASRRVMTCLAQSLSADGR